MDTNVKEPRILLVEDNGRIGRGRWRPCANTGWVTRCES